MIEDFFTVSFQFQTGHYCGCLFSHTVEILTENGEDQLVEYTELK